jgi:hypothetical protein
VQRKRVIRCLAARAEPRISRPSLTRAAFANGWRFKPNAAALTLADFVMMAEVRISHAASNRRRRSNRPHGWPHDITYQSFSFPIIQIYAIFCFSAIVALRKERLAMERFVAIAPRRRLMSCGGAVRQAGAVSRFRDGSSADARDRGAVEASPAGARSPSIGGESEDRIFSKPDGLQALHRQRSATANGSKRQSLSLPCLPAGVPSRRRFRRPKVGAFAVFQEMKK